MPVLVRNAAAARRTSLFFIGVLSAIAVATSLVIASVVWSKRCGAAARESFATEECAGLSADAMRASDRCRVDAPRVTMGKLCVEDACLSASDLRNLQSVTSHVEGKNKYIDAQFRGIHGRLGRMMAERRADFERIGGGLDEAAEMVEDLKEVDARGGDRVFVKDGHRIHVFEKTGTHDFNVVAGGKVEILVVGGGGSGNGGGGGGGGGGVIHKKGYDVNATNYAITVGDGGRGGSRSSANKGASSRFGDVVAEGGGKGFYLGQSSPGSANNGGSGGGGARRGTPGRGTAGQGHDGGDGWQVSGHYHTRGAGGGGAGERGKQGTDTSAGDGGDGVMIPITGATTYYGGGGGGSYQGANYARSKGGMGGGGDGGRNTGGIKHDGGDGGPGTGGGGGSGGERGSQWTKNGDGGSGTVIVRYPIQEFVSLSGAVDSYVTPDGYRVYEVKKTGRNMIRVTSPGYVDVFLVGGGARGTYNYGGGGGFTTTKKAVYVKPGTLVVTVGQGGRSGSTDGDPSTFTNADGTVVRAEGGKGDGRGGSGGGHGSSGSGCGGGDSTGGTDGGDGGGGHTRHRSYVEAWKPKGQGTTTRAFGEASGKLYAGGGGSHRCGHIVDEGGKGGGGRGGGMNPESGEPNTGGGGGGARGSYSRNYGDGGSGIVLIRHRVPGSSAAQVLKPDGHAHPPLGTPSIVNYVKGRDYVVMDEANPSKAIRQWSGAMPGIDDQPWKYFVVLKGNHRAALEKRTTFVYEAEVPMDGTYSFQVRLQTNGSGKNDSFYVVVNGVNYAWHTGRPRSWAWRTFRVDLNAGRNTIGLRLREETPFCAVRLSN